MSERAWRTRLSDEMLRECVDEAIRRGVLQQTGCLYRQGQLRDDWKWTSGDDGPGYPSDSYMAAMVRDVTPVYRLAPREDET